MEHRFATDVEHILATLPSRPKICMDASVALPPAKYSIVCDANTYEALGQRVERELAAQCIMLPGTPVPDMETVSLIRRETASADTLVALGSGTINDLCKYASFLDHKPYVAFPTAPSMNGYTSANASIIENGKKQSHAAHLPTAVLCDMDIIASAPIRMLRAGLGDSLARSTAQADWLLSHFIKGTHYDARPFTLLAPYEPALLENAAALGRGDKDAVMKLMEVLLLSGFGMTLAGGSYPASGGEHMIAHTYESLYGAGGTLHGEQIGITALTMARLQESIVAALPPLAGGTKGGKGQSRSLSHFPFPHPPPPQTGEVKESEVEKIHSIMLPSPRIEAILKTASCHTTPKELGWDEEKYAQAVKQARFSRDRFTFLNLME